ncbi:hypothetical protein JYQ62_08375 [Nostoc sp. UHCC 0702]|nr:hypothetical protein JYQ62_08375 [Nostoc sp. UHCC 0702]
MKPKYVTREKRIRQLEKEVQQLKQQVQTLTELLDFTTAMVYRSRSIERAKLGRDFHD